MAVKPEPYDVGDDVDVEQTFTDAAGALIDPAMVTLKIYCPDGETVEVAKAAMSNPTTGLYVYTYRIANGWGVYELAWFGDNPFGIVGRDVFHVKRPAGPDS